MKKQKSKRLATSPHHVKLTVPATLGTRTKQLYDETFLYTSKQLRRSYVTKALGLQKDILEKESKLFYTEDALMKGEEALEFNKKGCLDI